MLLEVRSIYGGIMAKYNVFAKDNKYLGTIHGADPAEALDEAKLFGMTDADHVEERDDDSPYGG